MDFNLASELFEYNEHTGQLTWRVARSHRVKVGGIAGTTHPSGRLSVRIGKNYYVHRIAWLIMTGKWPENQIDHIDRDPSNNKWSNLRDVTQTENQCNKGNNSEYPGVCKNKNSFYARLQIDGVRHHSICFNNIEDAIEARLALEEVHLGKTN